MKLSSLSFFCPALNEETNLSRVIESVREALPKFAETFEIVIIDDGSTDRTGAIADSFAAADPRIRVIHHPRNLGYGISLREGFREARYHWVMYTDSDYQYDINEIVPHLKLSADHDVLSGYVTKKATSVRRLLQSTIYNAIVRSLFGVNFRDVNCSVKIYSRKVLEAIDIRSKGFFIDAEMLISAHKAGFRIGQFPVTHLPRNSGLATGSKASLVLETIWEMILFKLGRL